MGARIVVSRASSDFRAYFRPGAGAGMVDGPAAGWYG